MQGERRAKRKAAGYSFSMPSRRLLYVKAVQGECRAKEKWLFIFIDEPPPALRNSSLTALNFYRTSILPSLVFAE